MTQAVVGLAPVAAAVAASAAPAAPVAASEAGEPTMEELAALVGDPLPEPAAEPVAQTATTEPSAEGSAPAKVEPAEATEIDAAAARAEKAAAAARAGSRRFAEMKAQQAEAAAAVQRAAREAEQLRRENLAAKQREEGFKKDPYKALKDAGMTDADLAARALRENTPEAELVRLRERVEASEAARVALEQRIEKQAQEARNAAARAKAHQDLISATEDESAAPGLSGLTPDGRLDMVSLALRRIEANGHSTDHFTLPQIVEAGEKYLAMVRKAGKAAAAPAVKPAAAAAATQRPKPSGATLTNAQAQTRMVAPADWDSLSDEQQMAHIAAALPEPST